MIIPAPTTYAEWADCFDYLAEGENDADVLEAMEHGAFDWSGSVTENFTNGLAEALVERTEKMASIVYKRFAPLDGRSKANEECGMILETINDYKAEMSFLIRVATLPVIPLDVQQALVLVLQKHATDLQFSVLDRWDEAAAYDLALIVRNNPFNS